VTEFSIAHLDKWTLKTRKRINVVVKQATNDVIAMASRTAPGTSRGGTIMPGYVPRDTGVLASSLVSSLNGSTALKGPDSYKMIVANMEGGDTAEFWWTAEYARAVHYRGWMWVDVAANRWPSIVRDAIRRAKAQVAT